MDRVVSDEQTADLGETWSNARTHGGEEYVTVLTGLRDPEGLIPPAESLLAARESGEWPEIEFFEPVVGDSGWLKARAVTRYEDVREILSQPDLIMGQAQLNEEGSHAAQPGFLLFLHGDEHLRVRRVLIRHLSLKRVQEMRPEIEEVVDQLIDELEAAGNSAELVVDFARKLPGIVMCDLLGIPREHAEMLIEWTEKPISLDVTPEEAHDAVMNIHDYASRLVQQRKQDPGEDLVSALVSDFAETLSDEEIVGCVMNVIMAAMDTTTRITTLSALTLLMQPDQKAVVEKKGVFDEAMVDEMIRYLSPASSAQQRYATKDITIGQNSVKEGERVMVSLLAANWDPEFIGESPELDLERGRTAHIAFSFGPHQCPGQHLGRLEVSIAVSKLLKRLPTLRLAEEPKNLKWEKNNMIYSVTSLPVEW